MKPPLDGDIQKEAESQNVIIYLLPLLKQQFQLICGSLSSNFVAFCLILSLCVVLVDAQVQCYVHQCCH